MHLNIKINNIILISINNNLQKSTVSKKRKTSYFSILSFDLVLYLCVLDTRL